jgi:ribosome-binding factor A
VGHSKRPRRGRARDASADALFERALLGESGSEGRRFDPANDRKTLQLCRQVQRALSMALADELLTDAYVESVEPMGGPGQLLVRVMLGTSVGTTPADIMARLSACTPRLRAIVATEISRKRVPMLSFVVIPPAAVSSEEGGGHDA